ncbi:methylglyoxal synthase [Paenibacillus baekrokdamisoli]|uniref:Methylglyoxal synthase n=1 Tax=Paenibacillus baekrokdamisoli TaxID=1712516 RepID=A0A3G9J8E6_9BACL|nr:methylglyoxal synthase [Paenibacillus baekrokdamisoli]BBH22081.1 methylglyoxal synthase [Paenibacillus baekrokdamisoli]
MNVAFVAHDGKKEELINFVIAYEQLFQDHALFGTGTTGTLLMANTGLDICRFKSGPLGGDQQIGAMVARNEIDLLIFFRDPLVSQPHEPDITALLRLCDVYGIPVATNMATAELLIQALHRGDFHWREIISQNRPVYLTERKMKASHSESQDVLPSITAINN